MGDFQSLLDFHPQYVVGGSKIAPPKLGPSGVICPFFSFGPLSISGPRGPPIHLRIPNLSLANQSPTLHMIKNDTPHKGGPTYGSQTTHPQLTEAVKPLPIPNLCLATNPSPTQGYTKVTQPMAREPTYGLRRYWRMGYTIETTADPQQWGKGQDGRSLTSIATLRQYRRKPPLYYWRRFQQSSTLSLGSNQPLVHRETGLFSG